MHNEGFFLPPDHRRLSIELDRQRTQWAVEQRADRTSRPEDLQKAAREFEAIFVNYLIKTMQETVGSSELFGEGLGAESYRDMMFQELARRLTQSGGIGLARQLEERLQNRSPLGDPSSNPGSKSPLPLPNYSGTDMIGLSSSAGKEKVGPIPASSLNTLIGNGMTALAQGDLSQEPHPITSFLKASAEYAAQASNAHSNYNSGAMSPDSERGFILPVHGQETSGFGLRTHPISGGSHFHRGVDLAAPAGAPILAARRGRVVSSGYMEGYGKTVLIEHADGYRTRYAHLQTIGVAAGDDVRQGQALGRVGQSGRATGPHLHFEVMHNHKWINPRNLTKG
ncbi:MAG: peptidoglycan DD-metalloendopeptidase family protein [Acidobacteria bacterium]|nr:peptidoglycan DD-metalloendopeptidase family protein [Acidobacteriota bacterium]MBI3655596.1 peptidoglycan DD-metalloendopeptidase family protein [Acidobacteriota bacterium]